MQGGGGGSQGKDIVKRQEDLQTVGSAKGQRAGMHIWKGRQCSTKTGRTDPCDRQSHRTSSRVTHSDDSRG